MEFTTTRDVFTTHTASRVLIITTMCMSCNVMCRMEASIADEEADIEENEKEQAMYASSYSAAGDVLGRRASAIA